ncbi:hypothetical protein [Emcibacter nanhaiensis]|uniref:Uncharacterized protein n=1 Tax=Emcibacter nanhaiensis TaxID=1505037 RepID=A0A501PSC1_9PROT|nr:hypothetical protein [Emcibacter nanhaiensis]TPD62864.1 hypothetical protein FIV46_01930 [Emcibacter nanhaiensis]
MSENKKSRASIYELDRLLKQLAAEVTDEKLELPASFSFHWHGIPFAGQILTFENSDKLKLDLVANLGHLAYSAENHTRRQELLRIFRPLVRKGDFTISRHSQIQMISQTSFSGDLSARNIMTAITYTLLDLRDKLKDIAAQIHA